MNFFNCYKFSGHERPSSSRGSLKTGAMGIREEKSKAQIGKFLSSQYFETSGTVFFIS